jgi:hypothetical protein
VGANQTRQQVAGVATVPVEVVRTRVPGLPRKPAVSASPSPWASPAAQPAQTRPQPSPTPGASPVAPKVNPERSLSGTITSVQGDGLEILGSGGRTWHVAPVPGALIRLNGKAAKLDALQVGDTVVILGQAEPGPGNRFLAHAITARHK